MYIPGSPNKLSLNVIVKKDEINGVYYLDSIYVDGLSCLYELNSTEIYEYNSPGRYKMTKEEIIRVIEDIVAATNKMVNITFNIELEDSVQIECPRDFILLRYVL